MANSVMYNGKEYTMEMIMSDIKEMLIDRLMLDVTADEIGNDMPLFENDDLEDDVENLGLDSIDGLEIMVGIQDLYGIKLDANSDKEVYKSVNTLALAVIDMLSKGDNGDGANE